MTKLDKQRRLSVVISIVAVTAVIIFTFSNKFAQKNL